MAVVAKRRANGTTYYVVYRWRGRQVWEPAGTDKRAAERLDVQRRRELAAGSYRPPATRAPSSVRGYLEAWLDRRTNRTADNDRALLRRHLLADERRGWFCDRELDSVRVADVERLAAELGETHLAPKSVAYVFGLARSAFAEAARHELISRDPFTSARPSISRRAQTPRTAYTEAEARQLLTSAAVRDDRRVLAALLLFTGQREGEAVGRRWRDLDVEARPLWALSVASQYEDQPLKTDRARVVPVHEALARLLDWWRSEGWERFYLRAPTADDWIVPTREGRCHTKSSAYKAWRLALARAGVANRSLHSTRHTFLTLARRGGARGEVIERVTHNASGDMVDVYTHWEWAPLCDAVACFPDVLAEVSAPVSADRETGLISGSSSWTRSRERSAHPGGSAQIGADAGAPGTPQKPARMDLGAADVSAALTGRLRAALADTPPSELAVALVDATAAALRGDEPETLRPLRKAAELAMTRRARRAR